MKKHQFISTFWLSDELEIINSIVCACTCAVPETVTSIQQQKRIEKIKSGFLRTTPSRRIEHRH